MAVDVTMPRLSDSMEEGIVLQWLVAVGDRVDRGQALLEVETDKANMTYESDAEGVLLSILVPVGGSAAVGAPIALIGEPGEAAGDGKNGSGPAESVPDPVGGIAVTPSATPIPARVASAPDRGERVAASPLARRMARALGVELAGLAGSGPGGRIVRADVEAAAGGATAPALPASAASAAPAAAPAPAAPAAPTAAEPATGAKGDVATEELTRLQQTVARRMSESRATVPDFELRVDVDMAACVELRTQLKAVADPAPSYNDMIVKAAALALREFPRVNGAYRDGRFETFSRVNVGVAVAADDALVVPTVSDADRRSLGAIARETRELAARVRDGSITPPQLAGATFTVSNLGMFGVDGFTAVINQPQAAILAVGALRERPAVVDGAVVARPMVSLTLACDHRIVYGADGARFLARLRELLEKPLSLAL